MNAGPWGDLVRRDHVLVMGAPGCGKTPFAAQLVRRARRAVFFDPTGEWSHLGTVVAASDLADDPDLLSGVTCRIVVDPRDGALLEDFAATVDACRAAAPFGGLVLCVDEVGDLSATHDGQELLRALHRAGHKDGVATVLASPCWTDFPARCRSTASRVYSFHQRAAADIAALNAELGRHVPDFGERAARWTHPAPPVAWVSPTLH